jgi:Flp pilus assembly protein TadD
MAFYRDWWAGARYAKYAAGTGQAASLIAEHERVLKARPADVEARMALAYLYASKGDRAGAERMWASLVGPGTHRKVAGN